MDVEKIFCPNCGKENVKEALFCAQCGKGLSFKDTIHESVEPLEPEKEKITCKYCAHVNVKEAVFCKVCGNALRDGAVLKPKKFKTQNLIYVFIPIIIIFFSIPSYLFLKKYHKNFGRKHRPENKISSSMPETDDEEISQQQSISVEEPNYMKVLYPFMCKLLPDMTDKGLVEWTITNSGDDSVRVKLTSEVQEWSSKNIMEETIPPNVTSTIYQSPAFKDKLYENTEKSKADLYLKVENEDLGETVYEKTFAVNVIAAGDFPLEKWRDPEWVQYLAAFVTPRDDSVVDMFHKARNNAPGGSFTGYDGDVKAQMKAIFNTLEGMGFYYVGRTGSSVFENQRVSLPGQAIRQGGNCIDGTLLYASLFEAIGFEPLIILVPGHAFVGVRSSPGSNEDIIFLETTLTGRSNDIVTVLGELADKILSLGSMTPFDTAVEAGRVRYSDEYEKGEDRIQIIDIKECRKKGILPMK